MSRDWLQPFGLPAKLRLIIYRHHYHEQVILNLPDMIPLISGLLSNPRVDSEIVKETIKCLQVSDKPFSYAPSLLQPTNERRRHLRAAI